MPTFLTGALVDPKSHIALSNLIAERIITSDTLGWIEEGGTELIVWLMETLNGSPRHGQPVVRPGAQGRSGQCRA